METIIKKTPCGDLKGVNYNGINRFLGIRYAIAERFELPEEVTKWDGIYEALDYGPAPIQKSTYFTADPAAPENHDTNEFMRGVKCEYSEDCLYLNIWTPENAVNAPVLIVIYGGGLVDGMSQSLESDGDEFARRGMITVTLNYRVNVFGFMYMKDLENESGKAGNYGYYDQHAAIEWVRHNIGSLGGNIDNMTIIGQSAGAASAEGQIKSPLNKGYFKQAIIQSSAGFTTMLKAKDNREAEDRKWRAVYEASGAKNIDELKRMPAEDLFRAFQEISAKKPLAFCNTIYGEDFVSPKKNEPVDTKIMYSVTSEDVMPIVLHIMGKGLAKSQSKLTDTYAYYFCRHLPGDNRGAWHSSDLMYVYSTLNRSWRPFTQDDYKLSERMVSYLESFIKTGDPNHDSAEKWIPFNKSKKYMYFDTKKHGMKKIPLFHLIKVTLFPERIS